MSDSWPVGLPETLWDYGNLPVQDLPQIPMMGVHFAQQFVIAFVFGWLFIAYFAWDRFNTRQPGAQDFRYRVMKEVEVSDLGGAGALRQAYLIYLITLLFLYVAMAFFGKLILQTVNALNFVGIQVDASSLQFDSPQWPLMLAFGFAGLGPLIPQLRAAEGWLFQRAYRTVGIPVRIRETTRNLVSLLDAAATDDLTAAESLRDDLRHKLNDIRDKTDKTWVRQSLNPAKLEKGLTLLAQLELLVAWARGKRGAWPGSEVSDAVRDMEQITANQADELLDGFERRVGEKVSPGEEKVARRQKYVTETFARAHELRDELTAILAIYVERDPSYVGPSANEDGLIRDAGLRELLRRADPPNLAGTGPELGVLVCILLAIPIYAVFTWRGLHPSLSPLAMADNPPVVLATAGLSALLLISIFWFPLLVTFAARQYYYDERKWIALARQDWPAYAEQRLAVVVMAIFVSVICLSGFAALWAFFIARDVSHFQALLVSGSTPFLRFFPSMALITIPLVWMTLIAADARGYSRGAIVYGICSALLVVACQALHLAFWYGARPCASNAIFLTDLFTEGCFQYYGGLDFFVMPILAFLAAVVFGNPRPAFLHRRITRGGGVRTAAILGAALALVCAHSPIALAQETPSKEEVTIGFRADVEPFSYKVSADGGKREGEQPIYRGFLADLCYWIFDGGDYSVVEKEVTAGNRFKQLRNAEIDVLCDPVTIRFSENDERARSGTFSPIVFATGISYLQRRNPGPGTSVYIGYVGSTTAEKVLEHLCVIDFFRVVPLAERPELATMCQTASVARQIAQEARRTAELPPSGTQIEWYKEWYKSGLLKEVEQMATEEETSVLRLKEASGPRKEGLEKSLQMWSETVAQIKVCREKGKGDCTLDWIVKRLGNNCDDLETKRDASQLSRTVYRFCSFKDHTTLIDWFCKPRKTEGAGMVYLGDREIILGKLQTWNAQHRARCVVENENGGGDLTYEPYAIMVRKPTSNTPQEMEHVQNIAELVQRRVYEFFSFNSLARAKFDTYFRGPRKDRRMSTALAYLFLLNSVEDERLFAFPIEKATAPLKH
ncbi:transporter substrate-binding domain-containing protein [Mesorhizobium sp. M00.F.Ca.ET.216.01.1.1]|uniref:transporter substrate-binding domain-containing protein n=1 Tax=Mesorhizobium sp. M00.F.Ca.ET.216.01.1.1 TaxID=2500528 RepID=UPI000FD6D3CD|nr:transporter substrate-binding domain-containing protein [Mesorhizobium sp. M00.F.Ca.ET.216.01.1.1]TGQ35034.1 transporter substrate-binding domain-containing protein [Mesorhizobium sp. M00.F.Ca.ET.216.01.1.1]